MNAVPFPVEPCFFPILNPVSSEKQDRVESVSIDLNCQSKIQTWLQLQGLEPCQLLQVSWAVVLSAYTRSKYPSFSYVDDQNRNLLCSIDLTGRQDALSLVDGLAVCEESAVEDPKRWVNSAFTWNSDTSGCLNQVGSMAIISQC